MEKEKLSLKRIKENMLRNIGMKRCVLILAAFILLLLSFIPSGSRTRTADESADGIEGVRENTDGDSFSSYEEYMEKRLEKLIGSMDGAGKTEVMITFKATSQKVLADEGEMSENAVKETDSSGGTRDTREYSTSKNYLTGLGQDDSPYVVQELKPAAEGVVVITQGGDDPSVAAAITEAAEALLGVPAHKVRVLKMSK